MRFIDEAKIKVTAGNGGPGCVSFWREAFVEMGGPDGGSGGAGGDVIFKATTNESTLQDFRYRRVYRAPNGRPGSGANKTGRSGEDIVILVPQGTLIRDTESQEILADLTEEGQTWVAATGGRGGKGNTHFKSSTYQAPKFAQDGELGEEKNLTLELKLLADVAIIGYPNAGKSTLISRLSAAKPKIADYAFTTLHPNLGVVELGDYRRVVLADVPGLIEGAHRGKGLGHQFLRHIERSRVLIHLLDGAAVLERMTRPKPEVLKALKTSKGKKTRSRPEVIPESKGPDDGSEVLVEMYGTIRNELSLFDKQLMDKPEIVVINKSDLLPSENLEKARKVLTQRLGYEPLVISAHTHQGLSDLIQKLKRIV